MPRRVFPERSDHVLDWGGSKLDKRVAKHLTPGCILRVMYTTDSDPLFPLPEGKHDLVYATIYKIKDGTYWGKLHVLLTPCVCPYFKNKSNFQESTTNGMATFANDDDEDDDEDYGGYLDDMIDYRTPPPRQRAAELWLERELQDFRKHAEVCPYNIIKPSMKITFRKKHIYEIPINWQPPPVRVDMGDDRTS